MVSSSSCSPSSSSSSSSSSINPGGCMSYRFCGAGAINRLGSSSGSSSSSSPIEDTKIAATLLFRETSSTSSSRSSSSETPSTTTTIASIDQDGLNSVQKNREAECEFSDPARTWNPDARLYYTRRLHKIQRAAAAAEPALVPQGFPVRINPASPLVWSGQDLVEHEYLRYLEPGDIVEIENALAHFKSLNLPISSISRETFPLPTLGPKITSLALKLYGENNGRGFFILRGLTPGAYNATENVLIYTGVTSYVARRRGRQDEKNNYLVHITDLGADVAPDNVRQAPYSNVPQPFHTDTADILALYCLRPGTTGGRSLITSAWKVYNSLSTTHISLLAEKAWAFDAFGRPGAAYTLRPLLYSIPIPPPNSNNNNNNNNNDRNNDSNSNNNPTTPAHRILLSFSRRPLTGSPVSPRTPTIPPLTTAQSDALDTVHFVATAHAATISLAAGDMIVWNNFVLLHGREGFTGRRHLLRLWLRDDDRAREWGNVPDSLRPTWDEAFGAVEGEVERWPVEPITEREFVTNQRRSSGHA